MNNPNSNKKFWESCLFYIWDLMLLSSGGYLVWRTITVLLSLLICCIGLSFIFFALSDIGVMRPSVVVDWALLKFRRRY